MYRLCNNGQIAIKCKLTQSEQSLDVQNKKQCHHFILETRTMLSLSVFTNNLLFVVNKKQQQQQHRIDENNRCDLIIIKYTGKTATNAY
jgi:hypothetical protein